MTAGCWDPRHPSTPRHRSLDSNHRSPAASCGQGFSKQQHLAPWQGEQAASWITLDHVGKGLRDRLGCSVLVSITFAFDGT